MNTSIVFRQFQESDRPALENIIRETWNYDCFCTPKTASKLAKAYLSSCLANQTFTNVALLNNVPVGIIMGKNHKKHSRSFSLRIKMALDILKLLVSREGCKVSKIFSRVERIDKELKSLCSTEYEGELAFFAVSPSCRGKGIGTSLFHNLVKYMRSQNLQNFYLFTDTSCNYGFYEHHGMKQKQKRKQHFDIKGMPQDMTFFLYDYRC